MKSKSIILYDNLRFLTNHLEYIFYPLDPPLTTEQRPVSLVMNIGNLVPFC